MHPYCAPQQSVAELPASHPASVSRSSGLILYGSHPVGPCLPVLGLPARCAAQRCCPLNWTSGAASLACADSRLLKGPAHAKALFLQPMTCHPKLLNNPVSCCPPKERQLPIPFCKKTTSPDLCLSIYESLCCLGTMN